MGQTGGAAVIGVMAMLQQPKQRAIQFVCNWNAKYRYRPLTVTGICKVVIAAVSLFPMHAVGQRNDLPQGLWVNCDPSSGKNAVVASPAITAKNGSDAWVQVVSVAAPLQGMCLNTTTLWLSKGHLHPYLPIFTQPRSTQIWRGMVCRSSIGQQMVDYS